MALTAYENRTRTRVRIIKSLPGHPRGAMREPHPAVLDKWIRLGIAEVVEETTNSATLTLPAGAKRRRNRGG